jgi:probable F420-dependent oxidoreductase
MSTTKSRPFRFGTGGFPARSRVELVNLARKTEDLGYATILMPDHFEADRMSTFLALLMAAEATKQVRIGTFVLDNDFRHPALLAQEAATLDLLSDGRLELGIGAGYATYDYAATGIPLDPPGVRVSRLAESVQILKRLLARETVTFRGDYYTTHELRGRPQALQQPHPPLLIGGGGKRLLSLAAREADIISLVPKAKAGTLDFNDSSHAATEQKIAWIREAAGARMAALELNTLVFECIVTDQRQRVAEEVAQQRGAPVAHVLNSVHFLLGTVEQITEEVQMWRERFGISYVTVFPQSMDAFAPVVAKLAG